MNHLGDGNPEASIMVIGDAPNPLGDRLGKPFVGDEGDLLDKMFSAIGLSRHSKGKESIYVSTIIPWKPLHTQSSIITEVEMLLPFIKKHIQLIAPKFLILMGDDSSNALLGRSDRNKSAGIWETFMGIETLTMRHPKYLIKNRLTRASIPLRTKQYQTASPAAHPAPVAPAFYSPQIFIKIK